MPAKLVLLHYIPRLGITITLPLTMRGHATFLHARLPRTAPACLICVWM
jgi:hypothetical protein